MKKHVTRIRKHEHVKLERLERSNNSEIAANSFIHKNMIDSNMLTSALIYYKRVIKAFIETCANHKNIKILRIIEH